MVKAEFLKLRHGLGQYVLQMGHVLIKTMSQKEDYPRCIKASS